MTQDRAPGQQESQQRRGTVCTDVPSDPLRATQLCSPYYGLEAPEYVPVIADAPHEDEREALILASALGRQQSLEYLGVYALFNATSPVNKLPAELLIRVFAHLQETDAPDDYNWFDVLRVCRHWFVVGSTAGILWRFLKVRGSTNLLHTGLARSRNAKISVEIMCAHIHSFSDVAACLESHLHRVQTLRMEGIPGPIFGGTVISRFIAENSMPVLRYFNATLDRSAVALRLEFPPEHFPQLQQLHAHRINILCGHAILRQLRSIQVHDCFGIPPLTIEAIVHALRHMENAEELILSRIYVLNPQSPIPFPGMARTALSNLRKLSISAQGPVIKAILSVIAVPTTAILDFTFPLRVGPAMGVAEGIRAVLPEDRRGLPILAQIVEAHVLSTTATYGFAGYTQPCSNAPRNANINSAICFAPSFLDQFGDGAGLGLVDFVDVLCEAPLEYLLIAASAAAVTATCWRSVFAAFPALRRLQLIVPRGDLQVSADVVFSALDPEVAMHSTVAPSSNGVDGLLAPRLQCLSLHGLALTEAPDALLEAIATCLENRCRLLSTEHALEELVLGLVGHRDEAEYHASKAAFEERLAPLIRNLAYERVYM